MIVKLNNNINNKFTTFQIENTQILNSSHLYIGTKDQREIIAQDAFEFINTVYDYLGSFKSFKDIQHFIDDSYLWYITYDGEQPKNLSEFDINKVLVVSVFRVNHGLKAVGIAKRRIGLTKSDKFTNMELRRNATDALIEHIKFIGDRGWAEVGDKLESYFHKALGVNYVIDPYILDKQDVFKNIEVEADEMHYKRPLRKGEVSVTKIAYGTIKLKESNEP